MYRIGIIYGANSIEWIKKIKNKMDKCELIFLPFKQYNELESLYMEHHPLLDGVMFSGPTPYLLLKNKLGFFNIPTDYFLIEEHNFYKKLTSMLINNKTFSLNRTFCDITTESNKFMGLGDILTKDQFPYVFKNRLENIGQENLYEKILAHIKHLLHTDKIELIITGSSNLAKLLEEENINHITIHPSVESMFQQLDLLLQNIKIHQLKEKQLAVGKVRLVDELNHNKFNYISLNNALIEFNQQFNSLLLINPDEFGFEILITIQSLRDLTNNFINCQLSNYLKNKLPFSVKISWGINSELNYSRIDAIEGMKLITENNVEEDTILKYFGEYIALNQDPTTNTSDVISNKVYQLSEFLEVSSEQFKQILSIKQNILTAKILAEKLNLTTRSANRLLNKLANKKAVVEITNESHTIGRPERQFLLTIENLIREIDKKKSNPY